MSARCTALDMAATGKAFQRPCQTEVESQLRHGDGVTKSNQTPVPSIVGSTQLAAELYKAGFHRHSGNTGPLQTPNNSLP